MGNKSFVRYILKDADICDNNSLKLNVKDNVTNKYITFYNAYQIIR